ncbi:hypothetical protein [Nitrosomonas sp. Nm58]|jgi:hypothetical protein|uniref:hypothetical protein n=1 Tax=Nitrosomonas sp. Nm58 TaxID=200126 RepID=UPI00089DA07A|nr:hypothetical protein [Nitrosomonas sp. Nm58]SDY13188.1 hypothetical protein SAMN05421754_100247 [Nitrosomonas sp. Nm58]
MREERHRDLSVEVFAAYCAGNLLIKNYKLSEYVPATELQVPEWDRCIYILRLGLAGARHPSILSIPNRNDPLEILYIGGHESGKSTGRFNAMLRSCRQAERLFAQSGNAENDKRHSHPVASCLTTSLLSIGFSINDCELDLVQGGPELNELELIIGYQERYHHLPPWNSNRKGASAFSS